MLQAQKVFRNFWKQGDHPFCLNSGALLDRGYIDRFSLPPGSSFNRDDITVYKDGSVFLEHIEFYEEYWLAFSEGWFEEDEPLSTPPRWGIDWMDDPT